MSDTKLSKISRVTKKVFNILSTVLLVFTFILVIAMVFTRVQGKTPQLFGYQLLRISSSSMSPKLEVGDVIISQKADPSTLKPGDVITYHGEYGSYAGKLITHEVISEPYKADGKLYFKTMGIANGYIDPEFSEDRIVGKMLRVSPFFSTVYGFFVTPYGLIVVLGVLAVLLVNEIFSLKRVVAENNDAKDSESNNNSD